MGYAYTLSQAISAIFAQKVWRGHRVRRNVKKQRAPPPTLDTKTDRYTTGNATHNDESHVHLADVDVRGPFRKGSVSVQNAQMGTL